MSGLLPGWTFALNARSGGGTYVDGYPWRIALHDIEGSIGRHPWDHPYPPHLWYDPVTRTKYQSVPLDRSAFALWQGPGPYTNKARALQVEIAGFAAELANLTEQQLTNLAEDVVVPLCRWVEQQGSRIDLGNVPPIGVISGSASEHAPQRMAYDAWERFDGLCSHRHVPDNDHWDTGTLNVPRLVEIARELLGTAAPAATTGTRRRKVLAPMESTLRPGSPPPYVMDLTIPRKGDRVVARLKNPNQRDDHTIQVIWGNGDARFPWTGVLGDKGDGSGPFDAQMGMRGLIDRWEAPAPGLCSVISPVELVLNLDPA